MLIFAPGVSIDAEPAVMDNSTGGTDIDAGTGTGTGAGTGARDCSSAVLGTGTLTGAVLVPVLLVLESKFFTYVSEFPYERP